VAGLGPDLYVVGGISRPRLSSSEISYLRDVDICTVEGGTEDLVWRKGTPMPLTLASVQDQICAVLKL